MIFIKNSILINYFLLKLVNNYNLAKAF